MSVLRSYKAEDEIFTLSRASEGFVVTQGVEHLTCRSEHQYYSEALERFFALILIFESCHYYDHKKMCDANSTPVHFFAANIMLATKED